jgi:hypothetical protein
MTIYIYVKTHRKTGLKYLGKTESANPYTYPGSGKYWKNHLKEHGNEVETEILHECQTNDEVKQLGLYYSNLWDVVNAVDDQGRKIWANLKPEEGDGGWGHTNTQEQREKNRQRCLSDNPIRHTGIKEKSQKNTKKAMWDPVIRERLLNGINSESWKASRAARVGDKAPCFDHTIYTFAHKDGRIIQCTQHELSIKFNANGNKLVKGKLKTSGGWKLVI